MSATLPLEIWAEVICWVAVADPADLARATRVCRVFHDLAMPHLYAHIVWNDYLHMDSLAMLRLSVSLKPRVRSLTIKRPATRHDRIDFTAAQHLDLNAIQHLDLHTGVPPDHNIRAHANLRAVAMLFPQLSHLSSLTFTGLSLPPDFYLGLQLCANLQRLVIDSCYLGAVNLVTQHSLPNLTEAHLLNPLFAHSHSLSFIDDQRHSAFAAIACVPSLLHLTTDMVSALEIYRLATERVHDRGGPLALRSLSTETFTEGFADFSRLVLFFTHTPALTDFTLRRTVKAVITAPVTSAGLLPALRAYAGPANALEAFARGRALERVRILRHAPAPLALFAPQLHPQLAAHAPRAFACTWMDVVGAMEHLHQPAALREFECSVDAFDVELLYMLGQLFTQLRDITIHCGDEGPDDELMALFGSDFLERFQRLERISVQGGEKYNASDPEVVAEQRAHLSLWSKRTTVLREVSFAAGLVWRRFDQNDWSRVIT